MVIDCAPSVDSRLACDHSKSSTLSLEFNQLGSHALAFALHVAKINIGRYPNAKLIIDPAQLYLSGFTLVPKTVKLLVQ